jgi:hypothetical protein
MCCAELLHLYSRHLTLKQVPVEETFDDLVLLPLGYQREGEFIMQIVSGFCSSRMNVTCIMINNTAS